jgi:hypothetical protein
MSNNQLLDDCDRPLKNINFFVVEDLETHAIQQHFHEGVFFTPQWQMAHLKSGVGGLFWHLLEML